MHVFVINFLFFQQLINLSRSWRSFLQVIFCRNYVTIKLKFFSGMKNMLSSSVTHLKKAMQNKIYQIGQLLPVLPSTSLLGATRHQALLQEIQQLSGLSEAYFKGLYRTTINRFVEFVQLIPEEPQNALGGLLNLGLARATLALRQYVQETISKVETDPLLNFAVFTAGLFFDVARVISQQKIIICDETGKYLQDWYPYSGNLSEKGVEYYKMYPFNSTPYEALNHESAALLARQLMPQEGFLWLSSDLELFIDWLTSLRGDHSQEGRKICRILSLLRLEDILGLMKNLPQSSFETIVVKELPVEEQFLLWLQDGINNGNIGVNAAHAPVHLQEDMLYLNNDIFTRFIDDRKLAVDAAKVNNVFSERFGIENQVITQEKAAYAHFLMQRGDPRTVQVRNGTLAFGGIFNLDKTKFPPKSPMWHEIKATFQLSRQLPTVKQTISSNQPPNSISTFRMR